MTAKLGEVITCDETGNARNSLLSASAKVKPVLGMHPDVLSTVTLMTLPELTALFEVKLSCALSSKLCDPIFASVKTPRVRSDEVYEKSISVSNTA